MDGLWWCWEWAVWDGVGVEAFDCMDVLVVYGCDGIGCVEASNGRSVVVGVCGDLCGEIAIVVGWALGGVAAAYFECVFKEWLYVS